MKSIYVCLIMFTTIIWGCRKRGAEGNAYYNRMKILAEEAKANPADKTALHKLEKYSSDPENWNRVYAYGYLTELATKNVGGCQTELIPFFDKALKDPDQAIRRAGAEAVLDIGSHAVEMTLPTLEAIIKKGTEDDVTWFSTEAVGKLENVQVVPEVLIILLRAAGTVPPVGTQDEAPQLRYEALRSIETLSKKNNLNTVPQLEILMEESQLPYKKRVAQTILNLNTENVKAREVLNSK